MADERGTHSAYSGRGLTGEQAVSGQDEDETTTSTATDAAGTIPTGAVGGPGAHVGTLGGAGDTFIGGDRGFTVAGTGAGGAQPLDEPEEDTGR